MAFDAKEPGEIVIVTFDFSALASVLSNAAIVVTTVNGAADPSPASLLSGAAQITGATVLQKIQGGVNGAVYKLHCQVDSATGERFALADTMQVIYQ